MAYLSQTTSPVPCSGKTVPLAGTAEELILEGRRSLTIGDLTEDRQISTVHLLPEAGLRSFMSVPLISQERVVATFSLATGRPNAFGQREKLIMERLAPYVAAAIENSLCYQDSEHSGLATEVQEREARQRADQFWRDLIATVSHELRTPLASIKGYITTLLQPDVKWEPQLQREFLEIANNETDRLSRLVGDLLTVSQLEGGALRLEKKPTDLRDVWKSVEALLEPLVSKHRLLVTLDGDLPPVLVDKYRLGQVISNLVSNAAKFSEPGTTIKIRACRSGRVVMVEVRDEGTGIPADCLDRVFDPFYRADGSQPAIYPGFGLGLSICRSLIEAQEGKIWAESEPGNGSSIFFTVPVAE